MFKNKKRGGSNITNEYTEVLRIPAEVKGIHSKKKSPGEMNIQEGSTFKTFQHLPFLGLQEDFYDHTIKINLNVSTFTFF